MFTHLHLHSPFSFLDGAASIEALVNAAADFAMPALAVTDHNNLSAAVRFHQAAAASGIKPITGVEVTLAGGHHITLLAQSPRGYANLCRIVAQAHLSQPRLHPAASLDDLRAHPDDLIALSGCRRGEVPSLLAQRKFAQAREAALRYREIFGDRFFLEIQNLLLPGGDALNARMAELAREIGAGLVATNNVHHLRRADFPVHDALTCARTLTRIGDVHPERRLNAQHYLRSPAEMAEYLAGYPEALAATQRIAEMCDLALHPGRYHFPAYPVPEGETAYALLERLVRQGARQRYKRIAGEVARRLKHELSVIHQLGFEDYFLAVWDLLNFARKHRIRYAGRGSAADSLVAHCLGITSVDPIARGLLFERFLSLERATLPDIDVDFQAERRDDVTHYVIEKYGRDHVAAVATYNTFQARSALRDLGKAMDFPPEDLDRIAKRMPYLSADAIAAALDHVPELRDSDIPRRRYAQLFEICAAVAGFPRHLSTHLGGIVITRDPILDISPLQIAAKGVPVIQFDKDDVEDLGLVKLDLLCLRMLSAVDDAADSIKLREPAFDYEALPLDDKASYDLVSSCETVGLFQLESPAQRALHARLQPDRFEDLIAAVAIIRPGPILADMVGPYLARRAGHEPVTYLHPALERILSKTYGVVLFQEQVIEIATEIAGFTPGEADKLRRAMTHHRSWDEMEKIGERFIQRARERGVSEPVAKEIFSYIHAYAGYGFCEAHAAAFADTAYRTAYLMAHHPAEFYAALLSHQPMGFWPPNTLIWEARRKGIEILGPDVNRSRARFTVEDGAIRISLVQIAGMGEASLDAILRARREGGPFTSLFDFCRRLRRTSSSPLMGEGRGGGEPGCHSEPSAMSFRATCPPKPWRRRKRGISNPASRQAVTRDLIRSMILCGAFDSLHSNRRQALWDLDQALADASCDDTLLTAPPPRGAGALAPAHPIVVGRARPSAHLPDFPPKEKWRHEFQILGIAPRRHPLSFARERLRRQGVITAAEAKRGRSGARVKVAGMVIRPHRPPTKSGRTVVFLTLEDETGLLDVTVFESVYQKCGKAIFTQPALLATGRLDQRGRNGTPASLIADHIA